MKKRIENDKNCKKVNNIWKMTCCVSVIHASFMWTKKMQNFFREKRATVVIKIRDVFVIWSNLILHIHDDWAEVLVRHFEMFAVGVRYELFPSTREANSYFEEKMVTAFGEGQSVDTNFCQWLVSISLHSTFASNILTKNTGFKS